MATNGERRRLRSWEKRVPLANGAQPASSSTMKREWLIVLGGVLGIIIGLYLPSVIPYISFLGIIFISLLKVLLLPFIAISIFLALAKTEDKGELKKLGSYTALYYFFTSSLACATGLIMANIFLSHIEVGALNFESYGSQNFKALSFDQFIASFFPTNIIDSFAKSKVVHIVVFSGILGVAAVNLKSKSRENLVDVCESFFELLMIVLKWVLNLAPLGVFALVAKTMASTDLSIFKNLGMFFIATSLAAFIHSALSLPLIGYFLGKFNPWQFFTQVKQALIVAISTASSSATLPVSMKCLEENAGVNKKTTSFVAPLGATLNMDGSALYQSLVVLLLANVSGLDLSFTQQLIVFAFVILSSAGTAGIPSGGVLIVGMTLETLGIPLELIGLYLLVDSFWDYPITAVNVWGDLIGTKTIDQNLRFKSN